MTKKNKKYLTTKQWNKVEWQQVEYDADCSDVEGLSAMPRPVPLGHQNYPINSVIEDVNLSLDHIQHLRRDGKLMPVHIAKINRLMQMFRRELNSVLEAVSSRRVPAKTAEDPVADSTVSSVNRVAEVREPEQELGILESGMPSRKRNTRLTTVTFCDRTSSKRTGGGKNKERKQNKNQKEPVRLSDSAYGSSPRNRPKSAGASIVKHRAKRKNFEPLEPMKQMEIEPTQMNQELEKELEKIRGIFRGMLDGSLKEMNPQLQMMQKEVSVMLRLNPDFSLMELVEEQLRKFY